jgi:hypothetical protein
LATVKRGCGKNSCAVMATQERRPSFDEFTDEGLSEEEYIEKTRQALAQAEVRDLFAEVDICTHLHRITTLF